jgi:hypothetical protein
LVRRVCAACIWTVLEELIKLRGFKTDDVWVKGKLGFSVEQRSKFFLQQV